MPKLNPFIQHYRIILLLMAIAIAVFLLFPSSKNKQVMITPPGYAAIGDSVAAGLGLESSSDSSACGRTDESYPNLVAKSLSMQLYNYACSGATVSVGISGQQTVNNLPLPSQIDQLHKGIKPKLITITIGANDVEWTSILARCVATTCGTESDTADIDTKLMSLKNNLQSALKQIRTTYKEDTPMIILTGYYRIFPESDGCNTIAGIDSAEQHWWNEQGDKLDITLADASSGDNSIIYTPVSFSGHDICSQNSWIQSVEDSALFHPNDQGQKIIAETIIQTYRSLKK